MAEKNDGSNVWGFLEPQPAPEVLKQQAKARVAAVKAMPQAQRAEELSGLTVKELRAVNANLRTIIRLLAQQSRQLDVLSTLGAGRLPFGDGVGELKETAMPTDGSVVILFKNVLSRPVVAVVRVLNTGDGDLDLAARASDVGRMRIDMTVLYDETKAFVMMPNAEIWGKPTIVGGGGSVGVEIADYAAWTDHNAGKKPGLTE